MLYSSLQDSLVIDNPVYGSTDRMLDTQRTKLRSQPAADAIESTYSLVGDSETQQSSIDEEEQTYEPVAASSPPENGAGGEMGSEYEIPQRRGFMKHEEEGSESYSRLNMSEVRYATLEPYISAGRNGTDLNTEKDTQEETYSTLQH